MVINVQNKISGVFKLINGANINVIENQ